MPRHHTIARHNHEAPQVTSKTVCNPTARNADRLPIRTATSIASRLMFVYHRTPNGAEIMRDGFSDHSGSYGFAGMTLTGCWVSDQPLDINEGAKGEDLLRIDIDEATIAEYEIIEDGKPYREWCVPAAVLNRYERTFADDQDDWGDFWDKHHRVPEEDFRIVPNQPHHPDDPPCPCTPLVCDRCGTPVILGPATGFKVWRPTTGVYYVCRDCVTADEWKSMYDNAAYHELEGHDDDSLQRLSDELGHLTLHDLRGVMQLRLVNEETSEGLTDKQALDALHLLRVLGVVLHNRDE